MALRLHAGRTAHQAELVLGQVEQDHVADDVAVGRDGHELLGAVRLEVLERVDAEVFEDPQRVFGAGFEAVLQVGKRNFARVKLVAA